jgi:two-component system, NtrC family, sensor kinase
MRLRVRVRRFEPDLPTIRGIPHALEQVLVNLLTNARDAMHDRAGVVTITTEHGKALDGRPGVVITVADQGRGIPPSLREHLFRPMFTTKAPGRGQGLGLSTCLRIVREHGGALDVESVEGQGTRFRVLLPRFGPGGPRSVQ